MIPPIRIYVSNKDAVAVWRLPAPRGQKALVLRARVPLDTIRANAERVLQDKVPGATVEVGFKITMRSLGRALKKVGKSAALRKVLSAAGSVAQLHPAIAMNPIAMKAIQAGQAALKIRKRAQEGDPQAQAIVKRALAVESGTAPAGTPVAPPGTVVRQVQRYLVTLEPQ